MNEIRPGKIYRQHLYNGLIGISFIVFMLTMAIVLVFGMLRNPVEFSQIPMPALLMIVVFWLGFTSLGVWMVLAYFRERLVLSETTIAKYDAFGIQKEILMNEITRLIWFSTLSGIIVESKVEKLNIKLNYYKKSEQIEIIKLLRDSVDLEFQSKWFMFDEDYRRVIVPEARATRDELILSLMIVALAGVFGFFWWIDWGANFLLMSFICLFSAVRVYQGH